MGVARWIWRGSATAQLARQIVNPPKPGVATVTASGVTHRLRWADRNAGWRMRCSCGWIDSTLQPTERDAILRGNRHARSTRRPSVDQQELELNAAIHTVTQRLKKYRRVTEKQVKIGRCARQLALDLMEEARERAEYLNKLLASGEFGTLMLTNETQEFIEFLDGRIAHMSGTKRSG